MQQAVARRAINHIWHFTRLENVDSIMRSGIIPRAHLENGPNPSVFNDPYRIDGQRTASCFSIGHPNYKMFYRLRMESPQARWAVVACRADVLWEKVCAFCHENAASNNVTCIPIAQRQGLTAFERIFLPIEGKPSRQILGIPDSCPTHPQAEVLIFDAVEPRYIVGAVFQDPTTAQEFSGRHPGFQMVYHRALFSARIDFEHWR